MLRQMKINSCDGLHVRPASALATALANFESSVIIFFHGEEYNAKSVIKILEACIKEGDEIAIEASGPDAEEVMQIAEKIINSDD